MNWKNLHTALLFVPLMSWLRWFKKIPSALKFLKIRNDFVARFSQTCCTNWGYFGCLLLLDWSSVGSLRAWEKIFCPWCFQRSLYLIWKRSLDLNIWIVSLWSILVTSMSGHCNQELSEGFFSFRITLFTFMSIRALSVMENRSERFSPRVCFPFVKMFQATCERQQVDSRSFQTIPRKIT